MIGKNKGSKEKKESPFYEEGKSKKEALALLSEDTKNRYKDYNAPNSPDTDLLGVNSDVKPLLHYNHASLWQGQILKNGREIHDKLDRFFNEVHENNDSFYSRKGPIKKIFDRLLNYKTSLIYFERDIDEFITATSVIDHLVVRNLHPAVTTILDQINRTFNRTFDLCSLKLRSISNERLSYSTILLSLMALIITLIGILK